MAYTKGTTIKDNPGELSMEQNRRRIEEFCKNVKENEDFDVKRFAEHYDISDDELARLMEFVDMTQLEFEQNPYSKTDLTDRPNVFKPYPTKKGETVEFAGVKLTCLKDGGKIKCESDYLGTFEYDPKEFSVMTKKIQEEDGTVSELPVFIYDGQGDAYQGYEGIGSWIKKTDLAIIRESRKIKIPDGVKTLDYTFANCNNITIVPEIPSSVESMHCTFENCKNIITLGDYSEGGWFAANVVDKIQYYSNHCVILPDGLIDMSGAFKNCEHIKGEFVRASDVLDPDNVTSDSHLPEGLVNICEAWCGCEAMDGCIDKKEVPVYKLPVFGEAYTPYLPKEYSKDYMANISNDSFKHPDYVKRSIEERAAKNDDAISNGRVNGKLKDSQDSLDENERTILGNSKIMSAIQHSSDDVKNGVEIDTNGNLSVNTFRDENGEKRYTDETIKIGTIVALPDKKFESGRFGLAAAGAVIVGGITSKASGKKTIGLLAGIAACYLLYRNMDSIANFTAKHLPDGKAKDLVQKYADSLYENQVAKITEHNNEVRKNNAYYSDAYNVAKYQHESIIKDMAVTACDHSAYKDISEYMSKSAQKSHDRQVFVAAAIDGNSTAAYASDAVRVSLDEIEKEWAENKNMTPDARNAEMRKYYTTLLKGIEAYSKNGYVSMTDTAINNTSAIDQLNNMGVRMVNRATVSEIMQSLKDMDAQYSFMDDATWSEIQKLNIQGVDMGNIRNYDSNYMAQGIAEDDSKRPDLINKFEEEKAGKSEQPEQFGQSESNQTERSVPTEQSVQRGTEFPEFDQDTDEHETGAEADSPSV